MGGQDVSPCTASVGGILLHVGVGANQGNILSTDCFELNYAELTTSP